jgi:hypothetical protein
MDCTERPLHIHTIVPNLALLIDRNFIDLVAQCMGLCNAVDTCLWGGM